MDTKASLIGKILDIEMDMFLRVPTPRPTQCQQVPEGLKLVRGSAFESWSEKTLLLYLRDMAESLDKGRNLMAEKYARMEGTISCFNINPLIDDIVRIETEWQAELHRRYPNLFGGHTRYCGDDSGALTAELYLRCELETCSDETLESRFADVLRALSEGRNLAEEANKLLFQRLGYNSLDEAEQDMKNKDG